MYVTLKLATSLDGCIATSAGESQWITGEHSRSKVHEMRSEHDGILTGIGTVLADDPLLSARVGEDLVRQPLRIVLDTHLRTPADARLFSQMASPVYIFCGPETSSDAQDRLEAAGAHIGKTKLDADGRVSIARVLEQLDVLGISSLMIEGGGRIAAGLLKSGLVDEIYWFRAPMIIGGDGVSVFSSLGTKRLSDSLRFRRVDVRSSGEDVLEVYEKLERA